VKNKMSNTFEAARKLAVGKFNTNRKKGVKKNRTKAAKPRK